MLCAEPPAESGRLRIFTRQRFQSTKENAKQQRTKATNPFGLCRLSPPTQSYEGDVECRDVRYFGHSRSDSFDAFESSGKTGCVLNDCFVQLVGRQRLAHAVQQIRVLLMRGVSRTRAEIKLTRHEKSNDDRRTQYQIHSDLAQQLWGGRARQSHQTELAKA